MAGNGDAARIQDPYCLRTLPQILGAVSEELASMELLLNRLVVARHENPLVFGSEADGSNRVAHHGLFQMKTLARRLDALHLALGTACATHLRRIDLRANAQPVSLQTVVLSLGAEEDASFASLAAHRLDSTVQAVATLTAVELVRSARALRMQGRNASEFSNPLLRRALEAGFTLPAANQDRDLRPDVDLALKLVRLPALGIRT